MKLGRLKIELAEKKPSTDELGASGATAFGGALSEDEYNADLRGSAGRTIYDKMRRSDARVKFALAVCELPIRAASWNIEPASEDKRDLEIAEALEANIFNMTITWDSFLHHVMLMHPFGFSIFEKVWEIVDGQVRYRKLAPRLPRTLSQWQLDETGGLRGIKQFAWRSNSYQYIEIPVEKLLVFTNEKEGSNFEGVSILRSAYKHWYYKDNLYRIDGIAAERHAVGVPKFKTPAKPDKDAADAIDAMGQRLYAQEQMYIRLGEGYDMTIEGLTGQIRDISPSISHHDKKISEAVLADFVDLGGGDAGSWALSKDKSSFFLMALKATATNICDTFNAYAVKPWVDYNYADVAEYPKLKCGNLETREVVNFAQAVTNLLNSGGITGGAEIDEALRDMLNLPQKPEPTPVTQNEKNAWHGSEFKRELTLAEKNVAFSEIKDRLNSAEADIIRNASEVQKRQIDKLVEIAAKIIEGKKIERLDDIDIPFRADMADAISATLKDLYQYGRKQVKAELVKQSKMAETPIEADDIDLIMEFLKTRAKAGANILAAKLKTTLTFEALNQIRQGVFDKALLFKALADLSDREIKSLASYSVSEAFNFGRSAEAEKHKDTIKRVQYSAILDEDTCSVCDKLDGEEWDYDDPDTAKYARGNPDCLGGNRCRCLLVYVYNSEV
jgi:hypothetical protein